MLKPPFTGPVIAMSAATRLVDLIYFQHVTEIDMECFCFHRDFSNL